MTTKLSEKEFKKLVIEVAKNNSHMLVQKEDNIVSNSEIIALYAKQIAISVNKVLENQNN